MSNLRANQSSSHRLTALWIVSILVYAFLYIPLIIVVVFSFNDSKLNAEWVGFTFHWYKALLHNHEMLLAARNSLIIAISASVLATVLGTMAGLAIHRYKLKVLPVLAFTRSPCRKSCWRFIAAVLSASTQPDAGHALHHHRPYDFLHWICRDYRTRTLAGNG